MKHYGHFIGGEWISSTDTIDSINPASAKTWATFAAGDAQTADHAIKTAHAAFTNEWREFNPEQRADVIDRLATALETHWESLVAAEVSDNGKRIAEVRGQFAGLHTWFRHFANEARNMTPEAQTNGVPGVESTLHQLPYGVVVAITPWNSPLMILAWKLAPALAAGNTVVVKPSEMASASTLEFAKLAFEAGVPAGVLNVVTGYGHTVGEALVRHPLTRKVTFTGSDFGGRKVAEAAANGVVPCVLELGGKSAQVVFADADLDNTVNGILSGIFLSNGQTCVAGSRLIVEKTIKNALTQRLLDVAGGLRLGDPMDAETQIGPLANEAHLRKVTEMVATAQSEGARCLLDGRETAQGHEGYYFGPTIFDGVTQNMQLWSEEVFGPVLAITSFETEAEAVSLANDSDYGLAGGVWTQDPQKGARVAAQIDAGTVYVNHYRSVDPNVPIGGIKLSGYGRELGPNAIKDFLQTKSIWIGSAPVAVPFP